ncbi:MAG TPA: helix-turn-helix transcriptional regulator [Solirubrobacterales bacterium]|nr:helix-turn-helix transcriptional regulator [Solirubrobacterales bacterium]
MPPVEIAALFGENLAHCRERAELSQEELGIRAELHRTEISQLERGLRVARIDTLVKLAGALGIDPAELIEGIRWTPGKMTRGGFALNRSSGA